jgi:hypothetical protein
MKCSNQMIMNRIAQGRQREPFESVHSINERVVVVAYFLHHDQVVLIE